METKSRMLYVKHREKNLYTKMGFGDFLVEVAQQLNRMKIGPDEYDVSIELKPVPKHERILVTVQSFKKAGPRSVENFIGVYDMFSKQPEGGKTVKYKSSNIDKWGTGIYAETSQSGGDEVEKLGSATDPTGLTLRQKAEKILDNAQVSI